VSDVHLNALDHLIADLGDIPVITESKVVRRRSRDFFWYSPILNEQLDGKSADLIVAPRSEADVIRTAAACARHRVPITVRAGGTGNYGQAVPLKGGAATVSMRPESRLEDTRGSTLPMPCPGKRSWRPLAGAPAGRDVITT